MVSVRAVASGRDLQTDYLLISIEAGDDDDVSSACHCVRPTVRLLAFRCR